MSFGMFRDCFNPMLIANNIGAKGWFWYPYNVGYNKTFEAIYCKGLTSETYEKAK
jgi:hypothetical protein